MALVIARTKLSAAFIDAARKAHAEGMNTGKLGRRILTNQAAGVGVKYVQHDKKKQSAETAGISK